jgi:predicted nucleic acid-binding protein
MPPPQVAARRAKEAIQDLPDLCITRYPQFVLLPRIWQLRNDLSTYDAAYLVHTAKIFYVS